MSPKPTIVFVPGAWHRASTWDKISTILSAQDYKCISITLPSTLGNPSATFLEDIEAVRSPITAETKQGHDVVVVVHSYGGAVGVSAIKGLTLPKQDRSKDNSSTTTEQSSSGHVIGLAMMATGFMATGRTFMDGLGGKPPPIWTIDSATGFAVLTGDPRLSFYHDLPQEEGEYWVSQLTKQALKPLFEGGEYVYAGWMDVPVWYLITRDDRAFGPSPVVIQMALADAARGAGADITVREVESSHSPMLSKPDETAGFILEAVGSFVSGSGSGSG